MKAKAYIKDNFHKPLPCGVVSGLLAAAIILTVQMSGRVVDEAQAQTGLTLKQSLGTVGTSSGQLIAAGAFASFMRVCVPAAAANPIWVRWDGAPAQTAAPSEEIAAGNCVSWQASIFLPRSVVNAIATASTNVVVEGH